MTAAPHQAVVLYDGDCPLCRKTTAILNRLDWFGRLAFHNCRDAAHIPPNTAHLDSAPMIPGDARPHAGPTPRPGRVPGRPLDRRRHPPVVAAFPPPVRPRHGPARPAG